MARTTVAEARVVFEGDPTGAVKAARDVETAYRTLGVKSSTDLGRMQADAVHAFETIKGSGTASPAEILRAQQAMQAKVAEITTRTLPEQGQAFGALRTAMQPTVETLGALGVNTGFLSQALAALTSPLAIVTAGAGALATAFWSSTNAAIANAKEVKALMAVSGLGAEAADNLADTFQLLGAESGALTTALFKMAQELDTGGAALTKIGLRFEDVSRASNEGELFLLVRDKISQLGTAAERSAALMDIFGRSGRALAPIFALSREKFQEFMSTASELSPWSDEAQKRTQALIIAQTKLGMTWDGLKIRAAELTTGPLTAMLQILTKLITPTELTGAQAEKLFRQGLLGYGEYLEHRKALDEAASKSRRELERDTSESAQGISEMSDKERLLFRETALKRDQLLSENGLQQTLQRLAREEAARKVALGRGALMEWEAAEQRLAALDVEERARVAALSREIEVVRTRDDQLRTGELKLRAQITQVQADAAAKRIELTEAQQRTQGAFDEHIRTVSVAALAKYGHETDGLTRREEARARVQAVIENQAARELELISNRDLAQRDLGDSTSDLDKAYAKMRGETNRLEDALELQRKELGLVGREALAANIAHTTFGRTLAQLSDAEREQVQRTADLRREQQLLATTATLVARGYTQQEAAAIALGQREVAERQRALAAAGQYFGYVVAEFQKLALQGPTVWESIGTATQDFVGSARSGLVEFFDISAQGFLSLEALGTSMLKALATSFANFLADTAVKGFTSFASGFLTGQGGGVAGQLGGSAAAALGLAGGVVNNLGSLKNFFNAPSYPTAGANVTNFFTPSPFDYLNFGSPGLGDTVLYMNTGGIVPGPRGAPHPAVVHGGELVIPPGNTGGGASRVTQSDLANFLGLAQFGASTARSTANLLSWTSGLSASGSAVNEAGTAAAQAAGYLGSLAPIVSTVGQYAGFAAAGLKGLMIATNEQASAAQRAAALVNMAAEIAVAAFGGPIASAVYGISGIDKAITHAIAGHEIIEYKQQQAKLQADRIRTVSGALTGTPLHNELHAALTVGASFAPGTYGHDLLQAFGAIASTAGLAAMGEGQTGFTPIPALAQRVGEELVRQEAITPSADATDLYYRLEQARHTIFASEFDPDLARQRADQAGLSSGADGGLIEVHNREALIPAPFTEALPDVAWAIRQAVALRRDGREGGPRRRERPVTLVAEFPRSLNGGRITFRELQRVIRHASKSGGKLGPRDVFYEVHR